jgi:hypothetical protein
MLLITSNSVKPKTTLVINFVIAIAFVKQLLLYPSFVAYANPFKLIRLRCTFWTLMTKATLKNILSEKNEQKA